MRAEITAAVCRAIARREHNVGSRSTQKGAPRHVHLKFPLVLVGCLQSAAYSNASGRRTRGATNGHPSMD